MMSLTPNSLHNSTLTEGLRRRLVEKAKWLRAHVSFGATSSLVPPYDSCR
jgi:hypothetical protein